MTPAVVLGGEHIGLAVARSLSAAGVPVHALGHRSDPIRHSRCRVEFVDVGAGEGVQERCLRWLRDRGPRGAVVLPCDDDGLELVARHRDALVELGYVPIEADDDVVLAMLDKERSYEMARQIGVGAPRTMAVGSAEAAVQAAGEIGYPCALKPRHSHIWRRRFTLAAKAFVAGDANEMIEAAMRVMPLGIEVVVTELVPGRDDRYCSQYAYLDEDGQTLVGATKRKLRQNPPGFGLGTFHLTDRNPEAAELGLRFLRGVGARGLACVEFKRDERDERLKLIECNHRFTGATEQLRAAGIDLALLAYNRLAGLPLPDVSSYRVGVSLWFPRADFLAFLAYRRRGELTLLSWLRTLLRRHRYPIARWDDPLPALVRAARTGGRGLRRLIPRRGSRGGPRPPSG